MAIIEGFSFFSLKILMFDSGTYIAWVEISKFVDFQHHPETLQTGFLAPEKKQMKNPWIIAVGIDVVDPGFTGFLLTPFHLRERWCTDFFFILDLADCLICQPKLIQSWFTMSKSDSFWPRSGINPGPNPEIFEKSSSLRTCIFELNEDFLKNSKIWKVRD